MNEWVMKLQKNMTIAKTKVAMLLLRTINVHPKKNKKYDVEYPKRTRAMREWLIGSRMKIKTRKLICEFENNSVS